MTGLLSLIVDEEKGEHGFVGRSPKMRGILLADGMNLAMYKLSQLRMLHHWLCLNWEGQVDAFGGDVQLSCIKSL